MRTPRYSADVLLHTLRQNKIATLDELAAALGTESERTVFRKLGELAYRTSYSHSGRFYTLDESADFDEDGLWSYRSVWFSIYGTLLATAEVIVSESDSGYFTSELDSVLHVGAKDALRKLVADGRLARERLDGRYLYCAVDDLRRRQRLLTRRTHAERSLGEPLPHTEMLHDELKAAIILFFSLLDEKQRRLYAGLESLKLGHGGDRRMGELLGMNAATVAKGRRQLLERDVEIDRVRKPGGGRQHVEKNAGSDRSHSQAHEA